MQGTRGRRQGFTLIEIILVIALIAVLAAGWVLWHRVEKLNTWAAKQIEWDQQVYNWIRTNSFQKGPGTGDPDINKPPPPPADL